MAPKALAFGAGESVHRCMHASETPLEHLAVLDPELARLVADKLAEGTAPPDPHQLQRLVEEIFRAVSLSVPLGRAVALGGAELLAHAPSEGLERYWAEVHEAAVHGPELGQLTAEFLVPAIRFAPPDFLHRLKATISILRGKGIYTLKRPLEATAALLRRGEHPAANAFLNLLNTAFDRDLTYNQSLHLSHLLPTAVLQLPAVRRPAQIRQLCRVVEADFRLADDFLDGLADGLGVLDPPALDRFVTQALAKWRRHPGFGRRMLALKTQAARKARRALQRAAALSEIRSALNRYLAARTGTRLAVRSLDELSEARRSALPTPPMACSDGLWLYLPEEIDLESTYSANVELFKLLVRIEAGYWEYGTYDFDLGKLDESTAATSAADSALSDLEHFLASFEDPALAEDLFTIAEQTRLRRAWQTTSPGLWRRSRPRLLAEAAATWADTEPSVLDWLYAHMVLESPPPFPAPPSLDMTALFENAEALLVPSAPVEASAAWTRIAYPSVAPFCSDGGVRLWTPFGWRVRARFFGDAHRGALKTASRLKQALESLGARVHRGDLVRCLLEKRGKIDTADLLVLIRPNDGDAPSTDAPPLSLAELQALLGADPALTPPPAPDTGPASWYPEWDHRAAGYLADHVRVVDRWMGDGGSDFYCRVLARFNGLVKRMQRAFELLRPEALATLRPWIEGDEFDYRALIDYEVDRRAGATPSERLYIKRIKRLRDVAVLLLVDLSRSTGNRVRGSRQTVVEVEKEAIVLFCEALSVVGDRFALAGFSGNGRLGVDYFHIKDFDQAPDEPLRRRIAAIAPQRATRMGAAIRHAAGLLAAQPARVRLLIVLGDGFPNDMDYKGDYAVADTRQAIGEARAKGIHVHAITVNLPAEARLDDLYGAVHHTLIGEVRELPDRLLRIYGRLTR
ncbi:MAG TPA: VWA domain-containing protein [Desulfobacteraceae bacterium]|nr:VWA domain-containing protein [Deltaproteobacteria bacterium]HDI59482.1 VWA domain-containing protein [Desulfobacteraceae bacterium]